MCRSTGYRRLATSRNPKGVLANQYTNVLARICTCSSDFSPGSLILTVGSTSFQTLIPLIQSSTHVRHTPPAPHVLTRHATEREHTPAPHDTPLNRQHLAGSTTCHPGEPPAQYRLPVPPPAAPAGDCSVGGRPGAFCRL